MALTQAQQDFVKQGGVIQSSDPNVMADYSSFVRGGSSNSITPATLIPTSALKLPTSPQEPDYLSTLNSIPPDNLLGISGEPTKTETIPSEIQKRLLELTGEIGGQKEAQLKAEETVGLPDFRKQLGDISGQIQSLQKEALAIPLQIQEEFKGRGVTKAGVAPIEIGRLRENAIKSLGLSAIAQTLQGNVALAQQQADRAVELEFAPKQAQLDFLKLAHEMNKDTLNREDAKRSKALEIQLAERQRVLDSQKENQQIARAMASAAVKLNPNNSLAQFNAQKVFSLNSSDPQYLEKVYSLVGNFQSDPVAVKKALLEQKKLEGEIANIPLQRRKLLADIVKAEGSEIDESVSGLVNAVIENPELFNQLTATEKGKISPALNKLGFTAFGKPLSDTAIQSITQTETAIEGVKELKETIKNNEQYIGPISGLQRFNPYSPARQIQADVDRIRQRVGKALEGGVLRKEDEEKYKKILATLADTPETAIYKINQLVIDLEREVGTYKKNQLLSGRNVPNISSLSNKVSEMGYDYAKMKADGLSDKEIKEALK